ncbi:MAG: hypothetical protein HS111_39870 [Kofleriaceae bacterium]|nr:hypothetical protein [Kofleriaceae bacterium]
MAKKQTRRSISVSRTTYERLKSFCETNGISMSQFVENRVGDFLGEGEAAPRSPSGPRRARARAGARAGPAGVVGGGSTPRPRSRRRPPRPRGRSSR